MVIVLYVAGLGLCALYSLAAAYEENSYIINSNHLNSTTDHEDN